MLQRNADLSQLRKDDASVSKKRAIIVVYNDDESDKRLSQIDYFKNSDCELRRQYFISVLNDFDIMSFFRWQNARR